MRLSANHVEDLRARYRYFILALSIFFAFILFRIWYLQIVQSEEYAQLAKNNRIRIRRLPASRGMILDRKKRILVDNRPSFRVSLVPEDIHDFRTVTSRIAKILNPEPRDLNALLARQSKRQPFYPVLVKDDISRKELAFLETHKMDIPGVIVDAVPRRSYNYNSLASHVIGYLGEIDPRELEEMNPDGYRLGDFIGKAGIERRWEDKLRGVDGGRQVEVDSVGREIETLSAVSPHPGHNLVLSIDLEVQKSVEDLLKGKIGAAVAMDPLSGRIFAMASSPPFNPDLFASGIEREDWQKLLDTPFHPLQNKAVQGQYPPGSVFKIITAIAALEEGVISPEETLHCPGHYRLGRSTYRCWRKWGHGSVNLWKALVQSCDVYFYQVALRLGIDKIAYYARQFGFGTETGIELGGEKPGLIPDRQWKRQRNHEPWYDGETLVAGIGQGAILVTPIQMAVMISAVANGGIRYQPHVVRRVEDIDGNTVEEYPSVVVGRVAVSERTLKLIQNALRGVIEDPKGTGKSAQIEGIDVFGKTGTAQVVKLGVSREAEKEEDIPVQYRDHAWFVAYASKGKPRIATAVLIQHGGHGATAAAPVAKKIIESVLREDLPPSTRLAFEESHHGQSP